MTTFAMIFGMLPLALGSGEGSEQRAPMAHAVIGGIITSTLLTLVVVPVLYTYLDDLVGLVRRRRPLLWGRWWRGRRPSPPSRRLPRSRCRIRRSRRSPARPPSDGVSSEWLW